MVMLLYNWHDLPVTEIYNLLDVKSKKIEKGIKSQYALVIRFLMKHTTGTIPFKPTEG